MIERTHDLVALHQLANEKGIAIPVEIEKLRPLNSYAVQFRYESCPTEMVSSTDCELLTATLQAWVAVGM